MGDNRLPGADAKTPCGSVTVHTFRVTDGTARPYAIGDPDEWQWCRDGETGNGRIDYPITVTGLGIGARSQALDILELKPVSEPTRVKAVKVY